MTQQAVGYEDCDIALESGRLRVRRWGAADAPAVLCVPGISANLCGFDRLAERLAGDTLQLVAIDLRGRGHSDVTGPGTYGWRSHARDECGICKTRRNAPGNLGGSGALGDILNAAVRQRDMNLLHGCAHLEGETSSLSARFLLVKATASLIHFLLNFAPVCLVDCGEFTPNPCRGLAAAFLQSIETFLSAPASRSRVLYCEN